MAGGSGVCYLTAEMGDDERTRRTHRTPLQAEFRVRDADDVIGGEISFDAIDISEGGAFLRSEYLLEPGDRIEVTFVLPDSTPIVARARVAWVTPRPERKGDPGMGLEFISLQKSEREAIARFVEGQRSKRSR